MLDQALSAFVTLFVTIDPPGLAPLFLGITIHSFRIAGGLLLFFIAFEMIFERRRDRQERSAERAVTEDQIRNIAVFPLAIPLIAGPGAISATILLSGTYSEAWERAILIGIVAVNLAAAWLVFLVAERIDRFLGATGRIVLTRLLGLILAALAVQFVIDGVTAVLRANAARAQGCLKRTSRGRARTRYPNRRRRAWRRGRRARTATGRRGRWRPKPSRRETGSARAGSR